MCMRAMSTFPVLWRVCLDLPRGLLVPESVVVLLLLTLAVELNVAHLAHPHRVEAFPPPRHFADRIWQDLDSRKT